MLPLQKPAALLGLLLFGALAAPSSAQDPRLWYGPVPGFTTSSHPAPEDLVLPVGVEIEFRVHNPPPPTTGSGTGGNPSVRWSPRCLVRSSGYGAVYRFDRPGGELVQCTNAGVSLLLICPVEATVVTPSTLSFTPAIQRQQPLQLREGMTNRETVRLWKLPWSIGAPGRERTHVAVDAKTPLLLCARCLSTPGVAASSLVEWRSSGLALGVGAVEYMNYRGRYVFDVGPPAHSQQIELQLFDVSTELLTPIGSRWPENTPLTFEATTNPPGYEHAVTWLSSTLYGSAEPTLGRGPVFTTEFRDTYGPDHEGQPFQWIGIRCDGNRRGQDGGHCEDPPSLVDGALPPARETVFYQATLDAEGGQPPYLFSLTSAPAWLSLRNENDQGHLEGMAPAGLAGTEYDVGIQVVDALGCADQVTLTLSIDPPCRPEEFLFGDADLDYDRDQADYDQFHDAFVGPGVDPHPDTSFASSNQDRPIDLLDYLAFQTHFTGSIDLPVPQEELDPICPAPGMHIGPGWHDPAWMPYTSAPANYRVRFWTLSEASGSVDHVVAHFHPYLELNDLTAPTFDWPEDEWALLEGDYVWVIDAVDPSDSTLILDSSAPNDFKVSKTRKADDKLASLDTLAQAISLFDDKDSEWKENPFVQQAETLLLVLELDELIEQMTLDLLDDWKAFLDCDEAPLAGEAREDVLKALCLIENLLKLAQQGAQLKKPESDFFGEIADAVAAAKERIEANADVLTELRAIKSALTGGPIDPFAWLEKEFEVARDKLKEKLAEWAEELALKALSKILKKKVLGAHLSILKDLYDAVDGAIDLANREAARRAANQAMLNALCQFHACPDFRANMENNTWESYAWLAGWEKWKGGTMTLRPRMFCWEDDPNSDEEGEGQWVFVNGVKFEGGATEKVLPIPDTDQKNWSKPKDEKICRHDYKLCWPEDLAKGKTPCYVRMDWQADNPSNKKVESISGHSLICVLNEGAWGSTESAASGFSLGITSGGQSSVTVAPNAPLSFDILGQLSGHTDNDGLAGFSFDLSFDGGDLTSALSSGAGVITSQFTTPNGLTNPVGFGGTALNRHLVGIGGAQNTIVNTGAHPPMGPVQLGVAHTQTTFAHGQLTAPTTPGTYTLEILNLVATVLEPGTNGTPFWSTRFATRGTLSPLTIIVQ